MSSEYATGFSQGLERLLSRLHGVRSAVVLDVDRTIISGTSWYRACKQPGLLIASGLQSRFDALNEAAYGEAPTLAKADFRARTLELVSASHPGFGPDSLREAGSLAAASLAVYPSAGRFIRILAEARNPHGAILYLSSGYATFISGVIEGLVRRGKLPAHDFRVFGSECGAGAEGLRERLFVSQFDKETVLRGLDRRGIRVDFYADDSDENPGLFAFVESRGGISLRVAYERGQPESRSWEGFLKAEFPGFLKRQLQERHGILGTHLGVPEDGREGAGAQPRDAIGIPRLAPAEYRASREAAKSLLRTGASPEAFGTLLSEMIMARDGAVLLRSRLYYYWLPQSLREDFDPIPERWLRLLRVGSKACLCLDWTRIFAGIGALPESLLVLLSSLVEHLLCAVTACLFAAEAEAVVERLPTGALDEFHAWAARLSALIVALHARRAPPSAALDGFPVAGFRRLARRFRSSFAYHKGLKELDDYALILRSNRKILGMIAERGATYDAVVVFPYGGIDLGYTLLEMMEAGGPGNARPALIHCYYSSKKSLRNEWTPLSGRRDFDLDDWIPEGSREVYWRLLGRKGRILLYDHNVTTFGTLAQVKAWLEARGCKVDVAVATVNYDNITAALLGQAEAEPMVPGWQEMLTYPATAEYLTAFNTWGTSQKSRLLYELFRERKLASHVKPLLREVGTLGGSDFKVCRVHNICDLILAWKHGATMIGIHAVHHAPPGGGADGAGAEACLPLPPAELESIRKMQKHVPPGMKQVLIIERLLPLDDLERIIKSIWVDSWDKLIQLQFRAEAGYVREIRRRLGIPSICVIGIFQDDFEAYLDRLAALPPEACDHVLVDMSKHQPDFIAHGQAYDPSVFRVQVKIAALMRHAGALARSGKRLLIADDIGREEFLSVIRALKGAGVRISGIDMQNILELPKQEQVFTRTRFAGEWHFVKQRKSSDKFLGWREVLAQI